MGYLDYEGLKRYNKLIHNELEKIKQYEYVDLGLPSGTLWATMNVGATSETDYGNYYMYGMGAKTYDFSDTPYQGMEDPLPEEYDTAAQVWGEGWRMPTEAQMEELVNNATYQRVTNYQGSGINGGLVTGPNGNTIFLPAAGYHDYTSGNLTSVGSSGYYWSATPYSANHGRDLGFNSGNWNWSYAGRTNGFSVRPVHEPFPVSPAKVKDALGINNSTGSTTKYLNEQGSFTIISHTLDEVTDGSTRKLPTTMAASGSNHAGGLVPDTPSTAGTTKFLREDGSWQVPAYTAAQVQSDWNASSGMGVILNKPTTLPAPVSAVSGSSVTQALTTNTHYVFGTVTSLTITLGAATSGVVNEYSFEFDSGSTATTLSVPSTVLGIDTTSVEANTHYEVNIKYNATTNKYYGLMYGWGA